MMKVLQIVSSATIGGVQTHIFSLTQGLMKQGVVVHAVIFEDGPLSESYRELGIPVDVIGGQSGHDLAAMLRMRKILRNSDVDLIHFHVHPLFLGISIRGLRTPLVRTFHWSRLATPNSEGVLGEFELISDSESVIRIPHFGHFISKFCEKYSPNVKRLLGGWIGVSDYVCRAVTKDYPRYKNLPHRPIYLSVDESRFYPGDEALLEEDFRKNHIRMVTHCRIAGMKCPSKSIEMVRILRDVYKISVELFLVGSGPLLEKCRNCVSQYGLESKVHIVGPHLHPERFLRNAHISLSFSVWESFGLSALEAIRCGTPVIASPATGALQEWLLEGEGVLYADDFSPEAAARKIVPVLQSVELWKTLRRKGLALAEQFSNQRMVQQTIELYEEVLRQQTIS